MNIEYISYVNVDDEYADNPPTHARIVLNKELIARIYKLRRAVKDVNAVCIDDWDVTPELFNDEECKNEWDGSSGNMRLTVNERDFQWIWYLKHTSIECYTDRITFEELAENKKMLRAKYEDLPRLAVIEELSFVSKSIIEGRLKEGK